MNSEATEQNYPRRILSLHVFGWLLVIFCYRFYSNALLHQLHQPVLISPEIDNTYWAFHLLQIPEWVTRHFATAFDMILVALIIACIFFSRIWVLPLGLAILLWTYYITFNTFAGHHYYQVGFLFMVIPFIAKGEKSFTILFDAVRYYCCFMYTSSGLYKLFRGSVFHGEQMQSILMNDNASAMYSNHPDSILYLIQHPSLAQALFVCAAFIQLAMLLGFFTKKFDLWLLGGLVLFHISNYFLLGIPFLEQGVIFLVLIPKEKMKKLCVGRKLKYFRKQISRFVVDNESKLLFKVRKR